MRTVLQVISIVIIILLVICLMNFWAFISVNNRMGNDEVCVDDDLTSHLHPENVYLTKDNLYLNFNDSVTYTETPQEFRIWTRPGSMKNIRIQDPVSKMYLSAGPDFIYPSSKDTSIWEFVGDYIVSGPYFLDVEAVP